MKKEIPHRKVRDFLSGLLNELFCALGAGNGDLAFAAGDADGLAALGAVEIAVLPILDLVEEPQEFPIFLIPGVGIPGEHPEQSPEHQAVISQRQHQLHGDQGDEGTQQAHNESGAEGEQAQLVGAVAACHKSTESGHQPVQKLSDHLISPCSHGFYQLY